MHKRLELLITLHDLDLMIAEIEEAGEQEAELGFIAPDMAELWANRVEVSAEIDRATLRHYEKLMERYGRPVVPVTRGICHGCFTALPTGPAAAHTRNESLINCENCGRYLYWLS